jgi:protein-S-isoprenylcysteine O-methyltransferase Ste14
MQTTAFIDLVLCWILWSLTFFDPRKKTAKQEAAVRAPASRWGILLVAPSFACVWVYVRPVGFEKSLLALIVSMILGPLSVWLAWAAKNHLGKQWRYEAALNEEHELIKTGPYRWLRHPIYASILGMLLTTGAAWSWWPMLVVGLLFFVAGTEIRVRAEEGLLAERFQAEFAEYKAKTWAYIPFLR